MEKTEATHTTPRKGRTSGLFLTPTHVGLAVGVAVVGCITAFGAGVILGMWYTASEQITPYIAAESRAEERPSAAPVTPDAKQDNLPVTFYSALVHDDGQHEGVLAPGAPKKPGEKPADVAQKKGQDGAPKTSPPTGIVAAVAESVSPPPAPLHETPLAAIATAPAVPSTPPPPAPAPRREAAVATTPVPGTTAPTGRREPQTAETTTPAAPAPPARRETAPAVTATAKPTAMPTPATRRDPTGTEAIAPPPAPTTPPARRETTPVMAAAVVPSAPTARAGGETTAPPSSVSKRGTQKAFSVQVGSFRSQEHATRLLSQLIQKGYQAQITTFTGPGGDAWYRVRIGNFADRSAATQTAQQLKTQNQGSTVVAVD